MNGLFRLKSSIVTYCIGVILHTYSYIVLHIMNVAMIFLLQYATADKTYKTLQQQNIIMSKSFKIGFSLCIVAGPIPKSVKWQMISFRMAATTFNLSPVVHYTCLTSAAMAVVRLTCQTVFHCVFFFVRQQ